MPEIFTHPKKKVPWIKFDQRGGSNDRGNSTSAIVDHQRPATPEEINHFKARVAAEAAEKKRAAAEAKAVAEAAAAAAAETSNGDAK